MMPDKGKGKGALVALLAGAPSSDDAEDEMEPMASDHGFKAVARAFGIPPEREASAQAALKQYIKACMRSGMGSGMGETEEEY